MLCFKCKIEGADEEEIVECSSCGLAQHVVCSGENALNIVVTKDYKIRCHDCFAKLAEGMSPIDSYDLIIHDIEKEALESNEELDSLGIDLKTLKDSFLIMKKKVNDFEVENAALNVEREKIEKEQVPIINQISVLEYYINELLQYMKLKNIEIKGIPKVNGEDIYSILKLIAEAIGVTYSREAISYVHRRWSPNNENYPPSILVQFISRSVKEEWLTAAKNKNLNVSDIYASFPPTTVFIVDHLTLYNFKLLKKAKYYVKQGMLASACSFYGRIYANKFPDSQGQRVTSIKELDDLATGNSNNTVPASNAE